MTLTTLMASVCREAAGERGGGWRKSSRYSLVCCVPSWWEKKKNPCFYSQTAVEIFRVSASRDKGGCGTGIIYTRMNKPRVR